MELRGDTYVVIHLMIAGRLRWFESGKAVPKRNGLAAFDFDNGTVGCVNAGQRGPGQRCLNDEECAVGVFCDGNTGICEDICTGPGTVSADGARTFWSARSSHRSRCS